MDDIKTELLRFEKHIYDNIKNQLSHNHVPVTGIVQNCNYCKIFGNVFANGPIRSTENLTYTKHLVYKTN